MRMMNHSNEQRCQNNHARSARILFTDGLYLIAPTVTFAELAMFVCHDDEMHRYKCYVWHRWPSGPRLEREECDCKCAYVRE